MTRDKIAPPIDMDRQVELRITVAIREEDTYRDQESLMQGLSAPLFVINNVQIKDTAEKLRLRVLQRYMAGLREKELEKIREEGVRRAREIEDTETKGDWTEEDDQDS